MIEQRSWIDVLRRYLLAIAVLNLIWEFAHMPLYQLWETGTISEIVFAAVHCTGGDVLIALSAMTSALLLAGHPMWPALRARKVLVLTVMIGFTYTAFSEWLNISIRQSWAYSDRMPIIPFLEMGVSPALQWLVVPCLGYWWARRQTISK